MQGRSAKIDTAALERVWFDRQVSMHDIAMDHSCSLETVRNAAKAAGLPLRSTIMPEHPPLWEDYQDEEVLKDEVISRAARVRATWDSATEFSRRVTKGTSTVTTICLADSRDASIFKPAPVPGYMTTPLRTEEELYRDRKKGSAA